jgi:phosphoglycolate phosphatase-like HAD superfamily hydrolase
MIGDSKYDIQMAHKANMLSCAVLWGFRTMDELRKECPNHLAHNTEEIYKIIS